MGLAPIVGLVPLGTQWRSRANGIGGKTDPTWQMLSIQVPPIDGSAPDPKLQQFLILSCAHPDRDRFLTIFVCGKDVDRVVPFHLPVIPIVFLVLRITAISAQLLL